ncbi:MAG: type II-A CRISPR-associated protein Csn2 [Lachnospiraceae bacterium]|nr:type II-A CRISPR-associated protein Csn2 [Lachnospiraceae bacterium]
MRLIYKELGLEIELIENQVENIVVESPKLYSNMLRELWNVQQGLTGAIKLANEKGECKFSQYAKAIFTPFSIDCNEKRILAKLYQELREVIFEDSAFERSFEEVKSTELKFLYKTIEKSPYNLTFDFDYDITALFKLANLRIESESDSLLDGLIDYLRTVHKILNIDIIIFVGIKQYLEEEELYNLFEFCRYEKIQLVLLDNHFIKGLPVEAMHIVDKDLCVIELAAQATR